MSAHLYRRSGKSALQILFLPFTLKNDFSLNDARYKGIPKEFFRPPNTCSIYTDIIFIAAISFEPRLMQCFPMSELKQPSLTPRGCPYQVSRFFLFHPRRDAIFSLKRFICEPRRGARRPSPAGQRNDGRENTRERGEPPTP